MQALYLNEFQLRFFLLPVAVYAVRDLPERSGEPFCLLHYHDEFEILLIRSGTCDVHLDDETYRCAAGDVVLIPPRTIHRGFTASPEPFSHICIIFDLSVLGNQELTTLFHLKSMDVKRVLRTSDAGHEPVAALVEMIYGQCVSRHPGWDLLLRGGLQSLFGLLTQNGYLSRRQSPALGDGEVFTGLILDDLSKHYTDNLSSQKAAKAFSYSHGYFCRKFKLHFGVPFQLYLQKYRLLKSRPILFHTAVPISVIARAVGFTGANDYVRCFRAMFGHTPGQYRRLQDVTPGVGAFREQKN